MSEERMQSEAQRVAVEAGRGRLRVEAEDTSVNDILIVLVLAIAAGLIVLAWLRSGRGAKEPRSKGRR